MSKTIKYVTRSFLWGATAKVMDALIKFISVPLLLTFFGKENFGLISLAISVNAYLQLLDMGINTGAIKYFSEWIHKRRYDLLHSVARTSLSFYTLVGFINTMLLLSFSFFGIGLFNLSRDQMEIMQKLLFVLALFSVVNWSTSVFNQLLIANENIAFIQKTNIARSLLGLVLIFLTIHFKLSILFYFTAFTAINSSVLIPNYLRAKSSGLIPRFSPGFDWANFNIVFKYSLAIILMAVFQMTAVKLRPVILGIFSMNGVGIIADFRVMETITIFIISIGGMFISIFLPKTSRLLSNNEGEKIAQFAYNATKYTSIICIMLCMPFLLNGKDILTIYVGKEYLHLVPWLNLWVATILFFLHNSPIASLVLSTGRTKMLVFCSAASCVISLIINAMLCHKLEAGSAVVGYSVYISIQMSFYYFYFNNRVLGLSSWKVFQSFIRPALIGFFVAFLVMFLRLEFPNPYFRIIAKTGMWFILFAFLLSVFRIVDIKYLSGNFLVKSKYAN